MWIIIKTLLDITSPFGEVLSTTLVPGYQKRKKNEACRWYLLLTSISSRRSKCRCSRWRCACTPILSWVNPILDQMRIVARSCWMRRYAVVSEICRCIRRPGCRAGARDVVESVVDGASFIAVQAMWRKLSSPEDVMSRILNRNESVGNACMNPSWASIAEWMDCSGLMSGICRSSREW